MCNRLHRMRGRFHRCIHISTGPQPDIGPEHKSDNFWASGPQIATLRAERDPAGAPRLDPDAALPAPAGDADELGHDRRRAEAGTVVALV